MGDRDPDLEPSAPGRALLAAYRDQRGPSPAAADRLFDRLQHDLAQGTGPKAHVPGDSLVVVPLRRGARRWWVPAALLAAAATIAGLTLGPRLGDRVARHDDPAAAFTREPTTKAATTRRDPGPTLAPVTSPPLPQPAASPHRREPATPAPSLADEMQRMRPAQQALAAGDPQAALARLDDYAREFPAGRLHEESLALRAIARCQLGEADAGAGAREFLRARPQSMFAGRVRGACKLDE